MYEHGFEEEHDTDINWGYILQIIPIVANDTVDSTNDVNLAAEKTPRVML